MKRRAQRVVELAVRRLVNAGARGQNAHQVGDHDVRASLLNTIDAVQCHIDRKAPCRAECQRLVLG